MKTIDLLGLKLQNFRSIVEPVDIPLPLRGLFAIRGRNLDTGGSSGVGKSSVNLGIAYALEYSPFPATELQSWLTEDPLKVTLGLQTPGAPLDISRSVGKVGLDVAGVAVKGGAKAVAVELQKQLGLTPAMLAALTFREQGSAGTFLSKTNVEVQEFFTEVLDLAPYEAAAADAALREAKAQREGVEAEAACRYLQADLEAKQGEHQARLGIPAEGPGCGSGYAQRDLLPLTAAQVLTTQEVSKWEKTRDLVASTRGDLEAKRQAARDAQGSGLDAQAQTLDVQASKAEGQLRGVEAELLGLRTSVAALKRVIAVDAQARKSAASGVIACPNPTPKALQELAQQLEAQVAEYRPTVSSAEAALISARADVRKKFEAIRTSSGSSSCSECGRPYENAADIEAHVQAMGAELEVLNQVVDTASAACQAAEDQLHVLEGMSRAAHVEAQLLTNTVALRDREAEVLVKEGVAAAIKVDAAGHRQAAADLRATRDTARTAVDAGFAANFTALAAAATAAQVKLDAAKASAWSAGDAVRVAEEHNARARENLARDLAALERFEGQLRQARATQAAVEAVQAQEQDFGSMVGREGFLGAIFDEVLAEVAEETNAILAKVPNVQEVTLAFRSETVTAKGTVKRGITPVVTVRGHEASLKSGCSGGMLGAVYLAADLAVIDVVSRRLGVSPGWLVLDESFEGLGPVEKEGYLEVLQVYAQKKLVIVVDHSSETKEAMAGGGVDLVFQNGRTRVETRSST
jgi:DNA repair exonuclease SbcCD ATPase subunit